LVKIKQIIPELRRELKQKDARIQQYEKELYENKSLLEEKSADVSRLKEEVHKLKSVLQLKVHKDGKPDILATIQEDSNATQGPERSKKQGVSGESPMSVGDGQIEVKHFEKDFRYVYSFKLPVKPYSVAKYLQKCPTVWIMRVKTICKCIQTITIRLTLVSSLKG